MPVVKISKKDCCYSVQFDKEAQDLTTKYKSIKNESKASRTLYKLDFRFEGGSNPAFKHKEVLEYIAWVNSPVKSQAESIGWVDSIDKLPIYDNSELFISAEIYNMQDKHFMYKYCSHIKSLGHEHNEETTYKRGK